MDLFRRRPPVWALILLSVLLWLGQYWLRGLWAPDEARYAYVARELRETGEWLVMHVNGELYPDKPAFLFWLINAASLLTGGAINSVSARLPSLLGMVLTLWAVARLAERWAGTGAAWRAAVITMTSYLVWWEGAWGRIDALLLGFEMAALYHLCVFNDDGRRWRLPAAYALLGLGVFAKGPVAIPVVLGAYVAMSLAAGEGAKLRRWHWVWGLPLSLAPLALWLAAARWLGHGPDDYFGAMFGVKFIGRVAKAANHANPIYYYLMHFPAEFMPWTLFLPAAYVALGPGVLRRRLLAWGLFVLAMFSLFSGKRQMYILAVYPAAAVFVAAAWPRFGELRGRWAAVTGATATGFIGLVGVAATAGAVALPLVPEGSALGLKLAKAFEGLAAGGLSWRLALVGIPMLAALVWLVRTMGRESLSRRWFAGFATTVFGLLVLAGMAVLPALNPVKTPLTLVPEARQRLAPGQPIHLYRMQLAIVPLHVERPGRELHDADAVEAVLGRDRSGLVVFAADDWCDLAARFGGRLLAHPFRIGGKRLVWAEFPVPAGAVQEPIERGKRKRTTPEAADTDAE